MENAGRERERAGGCAEERASGDTRWLDGSRDASFGLRRVEIGIVGNLVVSRVAATMALPKGLLPRRKTKENRRKRERDRDR